MQGKLIFPCINSQDLKKKDLTGLNYSYNQDIIVNIS